jgi:hypothetical protein
MKRHASWRRSAARAGALGGLALRLGLGLTLGLAASPSCQPAFTTEIPGRALSVTITNAGSNHVGTADSRIPITFTTPAVFTVDVQANDENGNLDSTFTGYVRFSIQPGTVVAVAGANSNGRNVELVNGVAKNVQVSVVASYGDARIWAEDLGYLPVDPAGVPQPDGTLRLPQCANGIDDNHNGLVDYPVDPGCYAPNDDTEDGGTYAGGASGIIYFVYPRIADVQGVDNNGAGTPFPNEQVQIDTQWNGTTANTPHGVVVSGVAATGFFATDIGETRGYGSVYAYTYSSPALMNVCDRLITFGGTSADFYGFTEINYPTWSLEEWDPEARPCLVPEPTQLTLADLGNQVTVMTPLEASLVRVPAASDGSTLHVAHLLGPGLVPYTMVNGAPVITLPLGPTATSCDYEGTGKIDFENPAEAACEDACEANVECSEYSQYLGNSQVQIVVVSADKSSSTAITVDGSASAEFDPPHMLGAELLAFTGNLTYFSGGSQFTIQARCADDIVFPGGTILPSSPPWPTPDGGTQAPAACVVNRAIPDQTITN